MKYADQLKHPLWQRKRLERLRAADWKCIECGCKDSQLHVHHERYIAGRMAWDYPDGLLAVLCEDCHAERHGKAKRNRSWDASAIPLSMLPPERLRLHQIETELIEAISVGDPVRLRELLAAQADQKGRIACQRA